MQMFNKFFVLKKRDVRRNQLWREKIVALGVPVLFLLIIFVLFFFASLLYPKCSDDFSYSFIFGSNGIRPTGLYDIYISQIEHYIVCNGRFWTHFVVQYLLMIDKIFFAVLNVIVYATCTYFLARLGYTTFNIWRWLVIALSFWCLMPSPGSTLFWLTGSINYLWASCLNACLLYLICSGKKMPWPILLLISFIAGNAHEGMSVGILMIMSGLLIVRRRNKNSYILMLAVYSVGLLLNIIAPGNFSRLEASYGHGEVCVFFPMLSKLYLNSISTVSLISYQPEIAFCGYILLFASIVCLRFLFVNRAKGVIIGVYIIGAIVCASFVIVSGVIYSRSLYGFCFICYMLICITIPLLPARNKIIRFIGVLLTFIAVSLNVREIPRASHAIEAMRTMLNKVKNEAEKGSAFVLPSRDFLSADQRYIEIWGLGRNSIYSRPCARYYGVSEFIIPNTDEYLFLQNNLSKIVALPANVIIDFPDDYHVLRLTCVPTKISGTLPAKEKPYKIRFVREYSKSRPTLIAPMVFCYESSYYVAWQTSEKGSIISVKTTDGKCLNFTQK